MSNDSFTETTSTGWFSRIGDSIKGILFGLICIPLATGLLWWNEGRTIKEVRGLEEGAKITVEADAKSIDAAKSGQLVHVTGTTTLKGPAEDEVFAYSHADLIKLRREVELFQWVETEKTETKTNTGGSETKTTTYSYEKEWTGNAEDSAKFKHPEGHENPEPRIESAEFHAEEVSLGAYLVPEFLLEQWNDFKPHPLPDLKSLQGALHASIDGEWLVLSESPKTPVVGDARVKFESIKTGDASVLARQVQDTFETFTTGQGTTIGRIISGVQSKEAMFAAAASENNFMAWLLRGIGCILMIIGFVAILNPLKVLADVLPFLGSIVGAGTGFVAFILGGVCSLSIVALSWLFYRPLLGIPLLLIAGYGIVMLKKRASAARIAA